MALVGHRMSAKGKTRYLIQNWWRSKQFFECDIYFLRSREAVLVWVTAELMKLPDQFPRTDQANCRERERERQRARERESWLVKTVHYRRITV